MDRKIGNFYGFFAPWFVVWILNERKGREVHSFIDDALLNHGAFFSDKFIFLEILSVRNDAGEESNQNGIKPTETIKFYEKHLLVIAATAASTVVGLYFSLRCLFRNSEQDNPIQMFDRQEGHQGQFDAIRPPENSTYIGQLIALPILQQLSAIPPSRPTHDSSPSKLPVSRIRTIQRKRVHCFSF